MYELGKVDMMLILLELLREFSDEETLDKKIKSLKNYLSGCLAEVDLFIEAFEF